MISPVSKFVQHYCDYKFCWSYRVSCDERWGILNILYSALTYEVMRLWENNAYLEQCKCVEKSSPAVFQNCTAYIQRYCLNGEHDGKY